MEEVKKSFKYNTKLIAEAILVAGVIVAGAILLAGSKPPADNAGAAAGTSDQSQNSAQSAQPTVDPVTSADETLGNADAPVTVVMYEDYQCPFCEHFYRDGEKTIRSKYVPDGKVQFVYRDYTIIGPESTRAAEAAHCAGDQGKFWQYHDYLFDHQGQENGGTFSDANLKGFAKDLGLDTAAFNKCFDSNKYEQRITDEFQSGNKAMPTASDRFTPKGFILKDGKLADIIQGAQPSATISAQIDAVLK